LREVADTSISRVSWFNDFIGRFSRATKLRPHKLADKIDHVSSAYTVVWTM